MLDFHVSYLLIYIVTSDCLDDMTSICVFINATEYYHLFTLFLEVVLYLYCSFSKINPVVGGGGIFFLFLRLSIISTKIEIAHCKCL